MIVIKNIKVSNLPRYYQDFVTKFNLDFIVERAVLYFQKIFVVIKHFVVYINIKALFNDRGEELTMGLYFSLRAWIPAFAGMTLRVPPCHFSEGGNPALLVIVIIFS